jgi:uncharacterized repeat protein (TIGR01451 family)
MKNKKTETSFSARRLIMPILAVLSLTIFLPAYNALAWGPMRETFTMETPASFPTFNSITNNPVMGDERNFVRVAEVGSGGNFVDEIQIIPGREYEVWIGYHNNAAFTLNSSGVGIAQQVRLSTQFPSLVTPTQRGKVSAIISSSNTRPAEVWDEAHFTSTENVTLRYKAGSARIFNSWATNGQVLSDSLFSASGTYLGANTLDGRLPGCAEFAGHVIYVVIAERESLTVDKMVSLDGKSFSKNIVAEAGQEITYRISFANNGNTDLTNVTFRDVFPRGVTLVPGSVRLYSTLYPDGETLSDLIDKNGYNLGLFGPDTTATLYYKARVANANELNCGENNLVNTMYLAHDGGETSSEATVRVNRACTPGELPEAGPGEIALAVIAILCVGVGGTYWYRSRKMLREVTNEIEGHSGA